jgi:hypothetical protein
MGRPKSENPRDVRMMLRLLGEERKAWRKAATASGKSVSAWLRDLANEAAQQGGKARGGKG